MQGKILGRAQCRGGRGGPRRGRGRGQEPQEELLKHLRLIVLAIGQVGANAQKLAVVEAELEPIRSQNMHLVAEEHVVIRVVNDKLEVVIRKNAQQLLLLLPLRRQEIMFSSVVMLNAVIMQMNTKWGLLIP